jgi:carbonic anhydrase
LAAAAAVAAAVGLGADSSQGVASLTRLKSGNSRAAEGRSAAPAGLPLRPPGAQTPFAAVLSCADARVPPETVFDASPGDLFVVRALGHVADRAMLASLEYAAERLQVPLLVIMGHESCDVVQAATEAPAEASAAGLGYFVNAIRPAATRVAAEPAATRVRAAILVHVEETINQLLEASAVLRDRAGNGQLTIAGAYYEMASGRVHFSEPVRVPPRITTRAAPPSPAPSTKPASGARPAGR